MAITVVKVPSQSRRFSSRPVRMLGNLVSASRDMGYLTPVSRRWCDARTGDVTGLARPNDWWFGCGEKTKKNHTKIGVEPEKVMS